MHVKPLLIATAVFLGTTACHPGGGGGSAQAKDKSPLLSPDGTEFKDAYSHTPTLHAYVAAGRWDRALDELTYIDREVTTLEHAEDMTPAVKHRLALVRPVIKRLAGEIRQHDQQSVHTARALVGAFAAITNDPKVRQWMRAPRESYP